jgi:two-component system, cell cycle response regulator DivK
MARKNKTQSKKVLVIEDESDLRKFSSWVLEAEGYLVLQAADGETGIKIARQEHPDLVLLDIRLPDRYGWSILEEIKASQHLKDIPVVIFTASADVVYKSRAEKMGAVDYLVKPVSAETLRECIKRIVTPE